MNYIETKFYDDYRVDFFEVDGSFEAWLYRKNYGVKSLIFGTPTEECSYDYFVNMVECSLDEHIGYYRVDYED